MTERAFRFSPKGLVERRAFVPEARSGRVRRLAVPDVGKVAAEQKDDAADDPRHNSEGGWKEKKHCDSEGRHHDSEVGCGLPPADFAVDRAVKAKNHHQGKNDQHRSSGKIDTRGSEPRTISSETRVRETGGQ